jgi:Amidohydrolase
MAQFTEAPIFDADQHMYETPDSLTKYLPEKYSRAVQFAQDPLPQAADRQRRERQLVDLPAVQRFRRPLQEDAAELPEHPHDVFRRNIWVSPFCEGCVSDVVNTVGWDKVLFGSDYPHPEGLVEPKAFWKYAEGMDERCTRDFMGDDDRRWMSVATVRGGGRRPCAGAGRARHRRRPRR